VSNTGATAVVFALAAALSFVLSQRLRWVLVVVVLVVPLALATPAFIRAERSQAALHSSAFSAPPPFYWPQINPVLLKGIVDHVPAHASVAMVNGDLGSGWARYLAYAIAPRQLVTKAVRWTIVFGETPRQAGLYPVRSWRYGADWLVED
jgi:hypothetical protein